MHYPGMSENRYTTWIKRYLIPIAGGSIHIQNNLNVDFDATLNMRIESLRIITLKNATMCVCHQPHIIKYG